MNMGIIKDILLLWLFSLFLNLCMHKIDVSFTQKKYSVILVLQALLVNIIIIIIIIKGC